MKKDSYFLVLTHDVDFLSLKNYPIFSKTALKFIKDCIFVNWFRMCKRDIKIRTYLKSFFWGLSYPLIKLGLIKDPWEKSIEKILEIEKKYKVRSTFFFIPFKNKHGWERKGMPAPKRREAKYDIKKYKNMITDLDIKGWEVGIHGLNAHINASEAKKELAVFQTLLPHKEKWGMRMHWLYQPPQLWNNLKKAGYYYDSTYGSNEEIGFKDNTYLPFEKDGIWILPLNIQDGTLLAGWRGNLSQKKAWEEIENILNIAKEKKALITILWHNISFAPPRYWENLYEKILKKAKEDNANIIKGVDVFNYINYI